MMTDTATERRRASETADEARIVPLIDGWFALFVALELVAFAFVPLLPLGVAAAGLLTPLRRSRRRMIALGILGLLLSLIVTAPFLLGLAGLQLVENGPVQTVSPR